MIKSLLIDIPPLELHCFFVPRKDFATGHWTLACCLILLLHIILICCSTSYSHNRGGFYISPIFCIDLDFSGTVKHQSESQNSWYGVTVNHQKNVFNGNQPLSMSPIVKQQNKILDDLLFSKCKSRLLTSSNFNPDVLLHIPFFLPVFVHWISAMQLQKCECVKETR